MCMHVVRNDKKKNMKEKKEERPKKPKKNEKERCLDENISFCYQRVVCKKTFCRNFTNLLEGDDLSNSIEK